jgi:WD40 repeat protein
VPETISFDKAALAWTLPWDADWVTAIAFLGAHRVAAGNNRGHILVWDLPEKPGGPVPTPVRRLEGHTNVISLLRTTADSRWLISSSYDHSIRYWDLQAEGKESSTVVLNSQAREIARQRPGRKVPAAIEATVKVQKPARVLSSHKEWVVGMALSKDERFLLSGDDGGQVILHDRSEGKEVRRWQVKGWAHAVALSPDNKQALVSERLPLVFDSGRHLGLKLHDAQTGKMERDLIEQEIKEFKDLNVSAAAYSPDGKILALGRGGEVYGMNGKVFLLDPASGKKMKELSPGHEYGITDLAFHPDGKHLASSGRDTLVRIWNPADGKLVKELGKPRGGQFKDWIHAIAFSTDGRWLAAADMAGAVQVWYFGG